MSSSKPIIPFRAALNSYTGYGLHACQIAHDLGHAGFKVEIDPIGINERFAPLPDYVRGAIAGSNYEAGWELLLHSPRIAPKIGIRTVWFTMWDSSEPPHETIAELNRAESILVPSRWNADGFKSCGVTVPITVIPLGINSEVFRFVPMDSKGPCVFGTAGPTQGPGSRKEIPRVIHLFQRAFPTEPSVRLHIKTFPNSTLASVDDPRIVIKRAFLSERDMATWFANLTCFVSVSKGEAWGLLQHQALATGRPLITVNYGGIREFFSEYMGYCLDYRLVSAQGYYQNCGWWAEPESDSVISRMREVFDNRTEARERGLKGAMDVAKYSWNVSNQKVINAIKDLGLLTARPHPRID